MNDISLKQLEIFVAVVEYGGFTRAAEELFFNQSTVSAHISLLEQALGKELFVRSNRRHVRLTADGEQVYPIAKRILSGLGFCGHYMHFHGGGVSGKAPIICLLAKQPGGEMSQQELGMHFDLKPGSLSEILSKLELNGLIERSRNPKDRRQLTIRLTETGRENARIDQAARIRFREQAFSALTHDEREDLAEMLDKIRVTWEELDD